MKNIILIIALLVSLSACKDSPKKKELIHDFKNQPSSINEINLNDIELGQFYNGQTTIKASVYNVKGVFAISLLPDNRAYKKAFMSNKKISKDIVLNFKTNLEINFNIELDRNSVKKDHYYKYVNNLYYSYIEDSISQDHFAISFSITDRELQKLNSLIVKDN